MQRIAGLLALTLTAALLAGCVYDPYTGAYAPCCGYYGNPYYGNPYYRYPPAYSPYGYSPGQYTSPQPGAYAPSAAQPLPEPYMAPQQGQPGAYAPPAGQPPPEPYAPLQQSQPGAYPPPPGQPRPEPDAAASPIGGFVLAERLPAAGLTRGPATARMPIIAADSGSM